MSLVGAIIAAALGTGSTIAKGVQQKQEREGAEASAEELRRLGLDIRGLSDEYYGDFSELEKPYGELGELGIANMMELIKSGRLYEGAPEYEGRVGFDESMVNLEDDPGYQARMKAGRESLEAGAGAKGQLFSGPQQKALLELGQEMGAQEYGSAFDRSFSTFQDARNAEYTQFLNELQNYNQNLRNEFGDMLNLVGVGEASTARQGGALNNAMGVDLQGLETEGAAEMQLATMPYQQKANIASTVSSLLSSGAGSVGAGSGGLGGLISGILGGGGQEEEAQQTTATPVMSAAVSQPTGQTQVLSGVAGSGGQVGGGGGFIPMTSYMPNQRRQAGY